MRPSTGAAAEARWKEDAAVVDDLAVLDSLRAAEVRSFHLLRAFAGREQPFVSPRQPKTFDT